MEVILLERVAKLGQMGERVKVKDGFARNFLLPRGKALRATEGNAKKFETQRVSLEARNLELKTAAVAISEKLDGTSYVIIRQAGETGQLYGSVSARDIAEAITAAGIDVPRSQVNLLHPSRTSVFTLYLSIFTRKWKSRSASTSPAPLVKQNVRQRARKSTFVKKSQWTISVWKLARP